MRTPHTTFYRGTKVQVILRDGSRFVDRFVERRHGCMVLEERGRVAIREIRAVAIWKGWPV